MPATVAFSDTTIDLDARTIGGWSLSMHALRRMRERLIKPEVVQEVLKSPDLNLPSAKREGNPHLRDYFGNNIVVVVNEAEFKVITVAHDKKVTEQKAMATARTIAATKAVASASKGRVKKQAVPVQKPAPVVSKHPLEDVNPSIRRAIEADLRGKWNQVEIFVISPTRVEWRYKRS